MCVLYRNNSPVLPGGPSLVYRFMFLCMLDILKQIAIYNLLKKTGYTQVVALSVFNLCFPQKQVLILITKAESKSNHWLCVSLVVFVSVVSFVFLWLLTVPDFKGCSSVFNAERLVSLLTPTAWGMLQVLPVPVDVPWASCSTSLLRASGWNLPCHLYIPLLLPFQLCPCWWQTPFIAF